MFKFLALIPAPCFLSKDLKEARVHADALSTERQELQGRVQQALEQASRLQRELEQKEVKLVELEGLRRDREDLRLLTACQEQRLSQTHRDLEQARAELGSLENVLDLLHLREVCVRSVHDCTGHERCVTHTDTQVTSSLHSLTQKPRLLHTEYNIIIL